jgi:hypothetical protein
MTWTNVDANEHPHGSTQLYQPDTNGVVYMAGVYSASGWGVLRSTDYGATWGHVGGTSNEVIVFGTPTHVYSMNGYPAGAGMAITPNLEVGDQPGTGTWSMDVTPAAMTQGRRRRRCSSTARTTSSSPRAGARESGATSSRDRSRVTA